MSNAISTYLKRIVLVTTSFVLALGLTTAAVPFLAAETASAATVPVTQLDPQGWVTAVTGDSTVSFVSDVTPGVTGNGALQIVTGTDTTKKAQFVKYAGNIPLSSVTDSLSYSTKQNSASFVAGNASYQIQVYMNQSGPGTGYTTLGYEPYVDKGNGAVINGVWQNWDVTSGQFYSSRDVAGIGGGVVASQGSSTYTLSQIKDYFPNATVLAYGLNVGSNNPSYNVMADNFTFNGVTYNFEVSPSLGAENFNTVNDTSYKGISVGFNAKDFSDITSVTVDISRDDGTHAIKHGTQDLFDLIESNTAPYQFTAPFVIKANDYNPSTDSFWTSEPTSWDDSTTPESVTITVTDASGLSKVVNSIFSSGAPSWPTYESIAPPAVNITSPTVNQVLNGRTITIKGTVTDTDFNHYYCFVTLPGSSEVGVRGSDCNTTWSQDPTDGVLGTVTLPRTITDGRYEAHVVSKDSAGNYTEAIQPFVLDNTKPVSEVTSPAEGAVTNSNTLTIEGTANDDNFSFYRYYIIDDSGARVTPDVKKYSVVIDGVLGDPIDISGLAEGDYQVRLSTADTANNWIADYVSFTIDRTAPEVPMHISPSNNAITNVNNFYFDWTSVSGAVEYEYQSSQNPTVVNGVLTTGVWNNKVNGGLDRNYLTDSTIYSAGATGVWYWQVRAIDEAGNKSAWTAPWKIDLDKTVPTTSIASAEQNTKDTVIFSGYVNDDNFSHYYCWLTKLGTSSEISNTRGDNCVTTWAHDLQRNGNPATSTNQGDGSASNPVELGSFDLTGLDGGDYTIHLIAVDRAGNHSPESTYNVAIDRTGPGVTITGPASVVSGTPTQFSGTFGEPAESATLTIVGTVNTIDVPVAIDGLSWTYSLTTAQYNELATIGSPYTVRIDAQDSMGNISSETTTLVVSAPAPQAAAINTVNPNQPAAPLAPQVPAQGSTPATDDDLGEEDVQGAQTDKNENQLKNPAVLAGATGDGWNILGLMWYWWLLIIAAVGAAWWMIAAARRRGNES